MAVVPTGAIYKALSFDDVSSRTYGVYITGQAVYNAPTRDVEMISIPGRNGAFALDKGRFENIEVSYPAGIFADNETDFAEAISDFRNFLCSRNGYVRLTDEYNPDEYRMAVYKSGLEVSPAQLKAGEFEIIFDCKPQRYLTSGEEAVTMGSWDDIGTTEGAIVTIDNTDGGLGFKSVIADIEPIQSGSGTPSPSNIRPISGYDSVEIWDDPIYGGSIEWNQQLQRELTTGSDSSAGKCRSNRCTATYDSATQTYALTSLQNVGTSGFYFNKPNNNAPLVAGHKYFMSAKIKAPKVFNFNMGANNAITGFTSLRAKVFNTVSTIVLFDSSATEILFSFNNSNAWDGTETVYITNYMAIDLTQIFGAGNEPTTVEEFTALFPKDYYTYNAGVTTCVSAVNVDPYGHYTISLNGTRYGGTLDVTTGVLTVTHEIVDGGTLAWTADNQSNRFYTTSISNVVKHMADNYEVADSVCSGYEIKSLNAFWNSQDGAYAISTTGALSFRNSQYTDADSFKNSMNGIKIVYPLATPQTVSLTGQQITALQGVNHIWANSGDITVEYGADPNKLVNPTLFDSSPLLEVEGYGAIAVNGYTFELENETMGNVLLWNGSNYSGTYTTPRATKSFTQGLLNVGDSFWMGPLTWSVHNFWLISSANNAPSGQTATITHSGISGVTAHASCTSKQVAEVNNQWQTFYDFDVTVPQRNYVYGTAKTEQLTVNFTASCVVSGITHTATCTETVDLIYDGAESITVRWANSQQEKMAITFPEGRGESSVSLLGHPTYIDCDLGAAYMIKSGNVISLNQYIDLGPELPILASGANSITFDNTVTDLKIVPRWWKV